MVQCPKCNSNVDQDFGMVTCPDCHAVFMIDYSGQIVFGDGEVPDIDEDSAFSPPALPAEEYEDEYQEEDDDYYGTTDDEVVAAEQAVDDDGYSDEPEYIEEPPEMVVAEPNLTDEVAQEDWQPAEPPPLPSEPDRQPVDISEFADSDESAMEDGEYLYTVQLSRIDSKSLREAVHYTLKDEKLELIPDQLMKKMIKGRLLIPDLHPLKAKRIVEQLQFYDIDITWRQRAVIIEDNEPDAEI